MPLPPLFICSINRSKKLDSIKEALDQVLAGKSIEEVFRKNRISKPTKEPENKEAIELEDSRISLN